MDRLQGRTLCFHSPPGTLAWEMPVQVVKSRAALLTFRQNLSFL